MTRGWSADYGVSLVLYRIRYRYPKLSLHSAAICFVNFRASHNAAWPSALRYTIAALTRRWANRRAPFMQCIQYGACPIPHTGDQCRAISCQPAVHYIDRPTELSLSAAPGQCTWPRLAVLLRPLRSLVSGQLSSPAALTIIDTAMQDSSCIERPAPISAGAEGAENSGKWRTK